MTMAMMIQSLSLENFRSFKKNTTLDPLKRLNIFIGPNQAGKSNVLKSLLMLHSLSRNSWQSIFSREIFNYDTDKSIKTEVKLRLSCAERKLLVDTFFPKLAKTQYEENTFFRELKYLISFSKQNILYEQLGVTSANGQFKHLIIHEFERQAPIQHV
jgi:AAA15 family ATPase/GTPase